MKNKIIKIMTILQMVYSALFTTLAVFSFNAEYISLLLVLVLIFLAGIGLWLFKRIAYIAELLLISPICLILIFQTGRRIIGLFNGMWKDCPPAYFLGFITEQIILIPAFVMVLFLIKNRQWYFQQSNLMTNQCT